jgi:hypothetical protein
MRGRIAVIVGVACIALIPATGDAGTVAAEVRTDDVQDQAGKEIKVGVSQTTRYRAKLTKFRR